MRYAFLLLALVAAQPLAAQTVPLAPEDSALVERLLDASGTTQSSEALEQQLADTPMMGGFVDSLLVGFTPEAFVDSARAAFARDFDREAIVASIETFSDPEIRPLLDFQQSMSGNPELSIEIMRVMLNPDDYDLADSLAVQRLVDASGMVDQFTQSMRVMMRAMAASAPSMAVEAAEAGMSVQQYADSLIAPQHAEMNRTLVLGSRYVYRDVSPEAIARLTDFYTSPSGRYYLATSYAGANAVTEPLYARLARYMSGLFSGDAPPAPAASGDGQEGRDE